MGNHHPDSSTQGIGTLTSILSLLDDSPEGKVLHAHLEEMLLQNASSEREYSEYQHRIILKLLDLFEGLQADDPAAALQMKLIRMRLEGSPSSQDLDALTRHIGRLSVPSRPRPGQEEKKDKAATTSRNMIDKLVADHVNGSPTKSQEAPPAVSDADPKLTETPDRPATQPPMAAKRREDGAERFSNLSPGTSSRSSIRLHHLQKTLDRQLSEVISQNERFGRLLSVEQTTLKRLSNVAEVDSIKQILVNEIDRLLNGHQMLQKKLEDTRKYVHILESEGEELNNELTRAHNLSLTDELTRLPNRRAFIRQLEDEVSRVQRYGYPLTLALIDLDHFKVINDRYGHTMGDEVLKNFSACTTAAIRHHDMLARYGGEEFAIVLPNTDQEGAIRALEKVKSITRSARCVTDQGDISLPTFSAGIALYKPGETTGSFIERADKALYKAKRSGRNRLEADFHEGNHHPSGTDLEKLEK